MFSELVTLSLLVLFGLWGLFLGWLVAFPKTPKAAKTLYEALLEREQARHAKALGEEEGK